MQILYYYNSKTNDRVYEADWDSYVLEKLGIKDKGKLLIKPKGTGDTLTLDQLDWLKETVSWYFSDGDWSLEDEDDNPDPEYWQVMADRIYEENLERRLLED